MAGCEPATQDANARWTSPSALSDPIFGLPILTIRFTRWDTNRDWGNRLLGRLRRQMPSCFAYRYAAMVAGRPDSLPSESSKRRRLIADVVGMFSASKQQGVWVAVCRTRRSGDVRQRNHWLPWTRCPGYWIAAGRATSGEWRQRISRSVSVPPSVVTEYSMPLLLSSCMSVWNAAATVPTE
jgi:hypothetical protein